jgi:hypothetical protein
MMIESRMLAPKRAVRIKANAASLLPGNGLHLMYFKCAMML